MLRIIKFENKMYNNFNIINYFFNSYSALFNKRKWSLFEIFILKRDLSHLFHGLNKKKVDSQYFKHNQNNISDFFHLTV